jgi:hypothetical protein
MDRHARDVGLVAMQVAAMAEQFGSGTIRSAGIETSIRRIILEAGRRMEWLAESAHTSPRLPRRICDA